MYQGFTTTVARIRTQSSGRIELPFTLKAHQEPTSQLSFEQKEVIIVINIILLRNSDIYLLDWLDLLEERTGETLGYLRLSLPHPILLSPPQLIGAVYSHYDYVMAIDFNIVYTFCEGIPTQCRFLCLRTYPRLSDSLRTSNRRVAT